MSCLCIIVECRYRCAELRALLEAPLGRVAAYEGASMELQFDVGVSFDHPVASPHAAPVLELIRVLSEVQGEMEVHAAELTRRRGLRSVVCRFKPGEVEEILDVAGREVRHDGVLLKANKVGKLVRHYFLFNDLLLTAEAVKGSKAATWVSSHAPVGRGRKQSVEAHSVELLRKCKER